jgi:hypothetical protein
MRKSKRWLTILHSVLLAAGLFCAQVCQVVCTAALCSNQVQTAQPEPEHAHCHQSKQPVEETLPESLPTAPGSSHDCQQHPVLQSLLSDTQLIKVSPQTDWLTDSHAPLVILAFADAPLVTHLPTKALFRPPPRSWLTTVQRI